MARRRGVPMRPGECRTTMKGVRYCYRPPIGVRFQPGSLRRGLGFDYGEFDDRAYGFEGFGARRGRGVPMRPGECRRTRKGVRYCATPAGVRFQRG